MLLPDLASIKRRWLQLRPLYEGDTSRIAVLLVASVAAGFAEAIILALIASIAAAMVANHEILHTGIDSFGLQLTVGTALVVALAIAGIRLLLQVIVAWFPAEISADVQASLRRKLIAAFTQAAWSEQSQDREGLFQELMTGQVIQISQVVIQVITALSGSAMFLALVVAAFALNPLAALVILIAAIALFFLLRPLSGLGRTAGRTLSQANVAHASGVSESVRLAEEAHVFGTGPATRDRVIGLINTTRTAFFRFQLIGGLVRNLYQSLVMLLIVAGLSVLYFSHFADIAALGAVVLMLVRASSYAQQFQNGFQALHQLLPYIERIQDAIARYDASTPVHGDDDLGEITSLGFHKVWFSYRPESPVLHGISFQVQSGEAIGIAGPSGAGKSTLVQLLLQLRYPDAGEYRVNGEASRNIRQSDWHRQFAYVPQDPRILYATVADNIRFFRDIDDTRLERAARLAHIHEDIMSLPSGYSTVIGPLADTVSGGQRQRICLARALADEPSVLVLDEPTSALDPASERAVQASLTELHGNVTVFIIAHRMSTLTDCDRILVLVGGRIEAFDTAAGLFQSSSYYRSVRSVNEVADQVHPPGPRSQV